MVIKRQPPHIVIFPSPGMGHLIPLAEFAKRLIVDRGFTATFIAFADFSTHVQNAFLDTLPAGFSSVYIPSIPLDDLPADTQVETRIAVMMKRSIPHLSDILLALKESKGGVAAFVPDLFAGDTIITAKELNIPSYLFFTSTLTVLSMLLHLPALHNSTVCEYRDLPEPVKLPGCIPMKGEDLLDPLQDRSKDGYKIMLAISDMIKKVDGILVNSFNDIEPGAYNALKEKENEGILSPLRTVGPLVCAEGWGENNNEYLKWLDRQPEASVIFVSFGSGGTLSSRQIHELAYGLESSGQRFLWVLRWPSDIESSGTYFSLKGSDDPCTCLPDGFLERTKDVGFVVPTWVPQVNVLNHLSTDGFVTHCGWNSTLESVLAGVPLIAWPLFAEQRMNAVLLSDGAGIALRLEAGDDGLYGRDEIGRVVKELMDGEEGKYVRDKMRKLRAAAVDNGGQSYKAMQDVADKWENSGS